MASEIRATRQSDSGPLLLTALVAMGALTGLAFGRVLQGGGSTIRLTVAGVVAVLVGALLARRHVLLSLAAGAAALVVLLGLLVFPGTTRFGLPGPGTVRAIAGALARSPTDAVQELAPAPALPSLLTAAMVAVWTAASACHALAVRSRSAVLALLPPAALLAFGSVAVARGPNAGLAAAFVVVAAAIMFGAALARMEQWGPVFHRTHRRRWAVAGPTGRWARRLALGATGLAVLAPGILPGYGAGPIMEIGTAPGSVSISPIVDIRPNLLQNPAVDLFTVRADRGAYWRMLALDRFDGQLWTATDLAGSTGHPLSGEVTLPGVGSSEGHRLMRQEIQIDGLATQHLPAAYEPVAVTVGETVRHEAASGMLVRQGGTSDGFTYSVVSRLVAPGARQLDRAYERGGPPPAYARYLQLPPLPPRVSAIAREITRSATTPYQEVMAIQEFLRGFTYDELAPAGHGTDHILNFLEETQRGYCEQFAGTMAVLVRTLGYPARVAVGFTPGTTDGSGAFQVTTEEAHAWVEVFFPGYGWLPFEPTPTRSNPLARSYLDPLGSVLSTDVRQPGEQPFGLGPEGDGELGRLRDPAGGVPGGLEPDAGPRWGRGAWALLGIAVLVLLLALVPVAKALVRGGAMRRARSPAEAVLAAYRRFHAGAADLGLGRRPAETLEEYRTRLRAGVRFSDGHLERLVGITGRAVYARDEVGPEQADEAREASRALARDVRRHVGTRRAVAGAILPRRMG